MYDYLKGIITIVTPTHVVIEVNDIGYKIFTANPFEFNEQEKVTLYVEQIVRENEISLYGFTDITAKMLFNKLLNVSGIGPKSALAILANTDHTALITAIESENIEYLVKFPGIGKKTAKQIALDLKGKLTEMPGISPDLFSTSINAPVNSENVQLQDALAALSALGYGKVDIKRVEKQLIKEPKVDTQAYLSLGLKLLIG